MLATTNTLVITGIEAIPVKVEVDIQTGLPNFEKVGHKNKKHINVKLS